MAEIHRQAADDMIKTARIALTTLLDSNLSTVGVGLTIREVADIGNRAAFALQVLDGSTSFDKQTITVRRERDK